MRVGLAGHDKVHLMLEQHLAKGLSGVQIVGQNRDLVRLEATGIAAHPAFDGLLLTVLLLNPVLRQHELGFQGNHLPLTGGNQRRRDGRMRVVCLLIVGAHRAVVTVNLLLERPAV